MNTRTFYTSIKLKIVVTVAVIAIVFTCTVLADHGKYVRWLGLPSIIALFALIIILAFVDIKYRRKPLFIISETEIQIYSHHAVVQVNQIEHFRTVGRTQIELVLRNGLPVPLVLWRLSKRDRKELCAMIENLIAEKRQNA